jgi:adenylate cyclase
VRENIGNKLDLVFEDMGDQDLKNIAFPVRAFNLVVPSASEKDRPPMRTRKRRTSRRSPSCPSTI